jgi:hypothetical protein
MAVREKCDEKKQVVKVCCAENSTPGPSRAKDGAPPVLFMPARSKAWANRRRSNPTLQRTKGGAPGRPGCRQNRLPSPT